PETALTAVSIEALACHPASWSRAAIARGLDFLASMQLTGRRIYAALDPALARGALSASPVIDLLRGHVTGHALLARGAAGRASDAKKVGCPLDPHAT